MGWHRGRGDLVSGQRVPLPGSLPGYLPGLFRPGSPTARPRRRSGGRTDSTVPPPAHGSTGGITRSARDRRQPVRGVPGRCLHAATPSRPAVPARDGHWQLFLARTAVVPARDEPDALLALARSAPPDPRRRREVPARISTLRVITGRLMPGRVSPGVSAGVPAGVWAGVLGTPAETPPPGPLTAQARPGTDLGGADPAHG